MEYTLVNFTKITFTILQNAEFPYAKLLLTAGCFHRRKPSVTEHNTITHDTTPLTTVLANTTHAHTTPKNLSGPYYEQSIAQLEKITNHTKLMNMGRLRNSLFQAFSFPSNLISFRPPF